MTHPTLVLHLAATAASSKSPRGADRPRGHALAAIRASGLSRRGGSPLPSAPPLADLVGPLATNFVERFAELARALTVASGIVRRRLALVDRFPRGEPARLRAERRHERALGLFYDVEDQMTGLIRGLTDGRPVAYRAWAVDRRDGGWAWASVEHAGTIFGLDGSGRWLTFRPALLAVRA